MKNTFTILTIIVSFQLFAQKQIPIRFEIQVPGTLKPLSTVFLVGSFNNWNPSDSSFMMKKISENHFEFSFSFPEEIPVEYKYTLGSWDYTEKGRDLGEINNRKLIPKTGLVVIDTVQLWSVESVNIGKWQLEDMGGIQSQFLQRNFTGRAEKIRSVDSLELFIQEAKSAWKKEENTVYNCDNELLSSNYIFFIFNPNNPNINQEYFEFVMSNHQIPAFIREFQYAKENPNSNKALILLNWHQLENYSMYRNVSEDISNELNKIFPEIEKVFSDYLSTVRFPDERLKKEFEVIVSDSKENLEFWKLSHSINLGKFAEVYEIIQSDPIFKNNNRKGIWASFLVRIAERYAAQNETGKSLAILDEIMQNASDKQYKSKRLNELYVRFDSTEGEKRFNSFLSKRPKITFTAQDSSPRLTGIYKDLKSGNDFNLADLKGKKVLIDFWATWCGPCRMEMPDLVKFKNESSDFSNFVFLSVCGDLITGGKDETGVKEFMEVMNLNYMVLIDDPNNSLTQRFGVKGWPSKFLFDENGKLLNDPNDYSFNLEIIKKYLEQK